MGDGVDMGNATRLHLLDRQYEVLRHYSSRLFSAWVSEVVVFLGACSLIAAPPETQIDRVAGFPTGALIAFVAAWVITVAAFFSMAYYDKYIWALGGVRHLEAKIAPNESGHLFAAKYARLSHLAAHVFHVGTVLLLGLISSRCGLGACGFCLVGCAALLLVVRIVMLERALGRMLQGS